MTQINNIYQTVADRNNPDYVEKSGPFLCSTNPWLGDGYYFWDNLLERAQWWGESHYKGKYMICQAYANIEDNKYLDLAGNMEQLKYFEKCYRAIKNKYGGKPKTIGFVIEKLKNDNNFPFQAVRVLSENCGGDEKVPFVSRSKSFFNFSPPMQICIYDKSTIKDYHIIYPEEYFYDGVV